MKSIIITIVHLLISISIYAADTSETKISCAAEKAEGIIQDNSLLKLSYPTAEGNVHRSHYLDTDENETFCVESFKNIFKQNDEQGLPTVICSFTHIEKENEFSVCYDWTSFFKWGSSSAIDPKTRKEMDLHNISIFLVRSRFNTNPPQYKATFLSNGNEYKEKVTPLFTTLKLFLNATQNKSSVTRAKFYTTVANKYAQKSYPDLAFKFAKFGLEGMPEQIADRPEHKDIISYKASCLNIYGDICKAKNDIPLAIKYYSEAVDLHNDNAFISLTNLYSTLGDDYAPSHIKLLEKRVSNPSDCPIVKNLYLYIAYLYKKIGNQEAADATYEKLKDLNDNDSVSKKRQRANTPEPEQSTDSNPTKRTRESSPQ